jgi:serine/threonine protein kinase
MNDDSTLPETHPISHLATGDCGLEGTTVDGRYLVERELDRGGVGAVYLARDKKLLERRVVVKVLLEKSQAHSWYVQKFQQEKEALARVDHPGVVGILDTGTLPGEKPYIVMQYIEGRALRAAIKEMPEGMDLAHVASIIKQAGDALSAVHEKKIYHRDLKPENIMLQRLARGDEQVKIVDFGIAKVKESVIAPSTVTGSATAGTIVYMSPEQLRGEKVSATSDIYSLGVIAYEMVTGRRPFRPDTSAHLAELQRAGVRVKPMHLRPRLPDKAQTVILKALSFYPNARYQSASEFGDALTHALASDGEISELPDTAPVEFPPTDDVVNLNTPQPPPNERSAHTLVTPFVPAPVHTRDQPIGRSEEPAALRRWWPRLAIGFVLAIALAIGAYVIVTNRKSLPPGGAAPDVASADAERSLVYSLTVQKMRDGKLYQAPFESSGQEIFESGYRFRLNVSSLQSGYLYVFNEGVDEKSVKTFTIIFPTPANNDGAAKLAASQLMQTSWNTFQGQPGTEEFWIVWSASPVSQMEAARDEAFKNEDGALKSAETIRTVRDFLTKHSEPKPETKKNSAKQQTDVLGKGDLLVKLVELEHR